VDALERVGAWRRRQLERLHGLVVGAMRDDLIPAVEAAKGRAAVADYDDLLFRAAALLAQGRGSPTC
jgi:hypothetical protein